MSSESELAVARVVAMAKFLGPRGFEDEDSVAAADQGIDLVCQKDFDDGTLRVWELDKQAIVTWGAGEDHTSWYPAGEEGQ